MINECKMEIKTNQAIIVVLKNVRKHSNADRLQLATVCGSQVVIGLDHKEGELGVYFDSNLQLSKEFAQANDLIRRKDENGKPAGGMFAENRKVKTQAFRGEKSDGFFIPLKSLEFTGIDANTLVEGYEFDTLNGVPICNKFIPKFEKTGGGGAGGTKKANKGSFMFLEHYDTPQLARNLHNADKEAEIIITEKLHGTSQRYGRVLVDTPIDEPFFKKILLNLGVYIFKNIGFNIQFTKWDYLNGTRRVVLDTQNKRDTSYHDDSLREISISKMKGNLRKGEILYFEVVGYEPSGRPIMPSVDTTLIKDKEFTKKYANMEDGRGMVYKYGQEVGTSEVYVYRITMVNEDGYVVELPWSDVEVRCAELGIKTVPVLFRFKNYDELVKYACVIDPKCDGRVNINDSDKDEIALDFLESIGSGPSVLDPSHIKEGVGLRFEKGLIQSSFKHKTYQFKVLESIIKDNGVVDMEEMESMVEETTEA
jgi:hypothetical protein